jgi:putative glycosyltransferase (TIGR04372 family)
MAKIEFNSPLDVINHLESNNGKLIINIASDAVGHVLAEFDNFARMRLTGEIAPDGAHLYMGPDEEFVACIAEMYGDTLCSNYVLSSNSLEIVSNIAHYRPDLTVDVGISSVKMGPIDGLPCRPSFVDNKYFRYQLIFFQSFIDAQKALYRRRLQTSKFLPMAQKFPIASNLEQFINARGQKIALLQLKDFPSSGGADATDPDTYLPSMRYLRDLGYKLVLVGREQYPEAFASLGVVDYANSPLATFKNDLVLFSNADFSLTGPSGISQFPEIMGTPFVYVNNWQPLLPPFSPHCVCAPAVLKLKGEDKFLTFSEQLDLMETTGVDFPKDQPYDAIPPDSDDILMATQEAIELVDNPLPLDKNQQLMRELRPDTTNECSLSRTSAAFLKRYQTLL